MNAAQGQRPLKLAFVIPRLEPSHGGVERYAFGLAKGLARRGVGLRVFTTTSARLLPELAPGLEIETLDPGPGSRASREQRFDAAARLRIGALSAWDAVQGFGPTAVHTHHRIGGGSHAAYLSARAHYEPRVRAWLTRASRLHRDRITRQRALWKDPRVQLFANSRFGRDHVCADGGIAPDRIPVIHNGVDLEAFRPEPDAGRRARLRAELGLAPRALVVAFVGSGFARKGLRFAIGMLARARDARVELLVAGRGRIAPYRRHARRLGVADRVHFTGPVDRIGRVYAACDAFLLPSLYESFSNAALEALACGLPVLVTRDSGIAEVVEEGREAFLLPGPDALECGGERLTLLARNPELLRAMGGRARHSAERLDQEAHVDRMLAFYRGGSAAL